MEPYVLGHATRERDRLDLQGNIYGDVTRQALVNAGIASGMRVLDVGCGSGDVTRLVSQLVGPKGVAHGVDRDEATVADARDRSEQRGYSNTRFSVGDIGVGFGSGSFDGLVGRFILMHQPDPAAVLAEMIRVVRPEGVIVFVESHMTTLLHGPHSHPKSHVYDELVRWKCRVVKAAGADIEAGLRMWQVFRKAGLPGPSIRLAAPVVGGADSEYYQYMEESVRSMLPQARALGIVDIDEERVNRIEHDLRSEVSTHDGVLVAWPVVTAWCRRP